MDVGVAGVAAVAAIEPARTREPPTSGDTSDRATVEISRMRELERALLSLSRMTICLDDLASVVGGRVNAGPRTLEPQMQQLSYGSPAPQVGSSTWQPPNSPAYHMEYGPWKNGNATSWKSIDNKTGDVISSGQNYPE